MKSYPLERTQASGFTLIEIMVVVAIVAILALMALPSYYFKVVSEQIASISPLLTVAEAPTTVAWATSKPLPADNKAAGLPNPDMMVGNYVSKVEIVNGAVNVTFGNHASGYLLGKVLTYRPAVVLSSTLVPVTWICGSAAAPKNMTILGLNQTNIPANYLPRNCK
jgi:type IV pilus assembly protein PilA